VVRRGSSHQAWGKVATAAVTPSPLGSGRSNEVVAPQITVTVEHVGMRRSQPSQLSAGSARVQGEQCTVLLCDSHIEPSSLVVAAAVQDINAALLLLLLHACAITFSKNT
jgi:hypothetical protein